MKPRVEGRVACIKMRVRLQPLQRYNYFLNHQTKNRKKSLMDAKIWETIQKDPKCIIRKAKVMYLQIRT